VLPPKDVQLAIAMSRANMMQTHQSPPTSAEKGLPPLHPSSSSSSLQPPPSLSRATSVEQDDSAPSTPTVNASNNYSIGKMPLGVSWRYVNILDENTAK
jgi:hypothetical protein